MKLLALLWAAALAAAQPPVPVIKPAPKTVVRGYFSAEVAPVVRIRSGDTVAMESAMIADPAMMREGGIPDAAIREAGRIIHSEVKNEGPGPHVLTGPVYVEGAEPGDTLEVRIKAVDLAFDYAIIIICPGCGMLPDDFPYWRVKSYPLDRRTMTARFHENLEEAGRIALREMLDFLVAEKGLTRDDAYLLAGSAVDLRVTQVVDGKRGIHATVAKSIFGKH